MKTKRNKSFHHNFRLNTNSSNSNYDNVNYNNLKNDQPNIMYNYNNTNYTNNNPFTKFKIIDKNNNLYSIYQERINTIHTQEKNIHLNEAFPKISSLNYHSRNIFKDGRIDQTKSNLFGFENTKNYNIINSNHYMDTNNSNISQEKSIRVRKSSDHSNYGNSYILDNQDFKLNKNLNFIDKDYQRFLGNLHSKSMKYHNLMLKNLNRKTEYIRKQKERDRNHTQKQHKKILNLLVVKHKQSFY